MALTTSDKDVGSSDRNVLARLDGRVPTSFYWQLTLLATIGGFLFGFDTANIGSALPFVHAERVRARLPGGRRVGGCGDRRAGGRAAR